MHIAIVTMLLANVFGSQLVVAQTATGQPAKSTPPISESRDIKTFKDCEACPEMVAIRAGTFTMGTPVQNQSEGKEAHFEWPTHAVSISSFAIGKTHITRGQFAAFVNETGYAAGISCSTFENNAWENRTLRNWRNVGHPQDDNHPVACINWFDAKAYVHWLRQKTGKQYRLPSEAEWEYAARAGTTTGRYWGERVDFACGYENVGDLSLIAAITKWANIERHNCNDGYVFTAPTANFKPNGFGLYDMLGNLHQWVEDCWHQNYIDAPNDGSAWQSGTCDSRVVRGGYWNSDPEGVRPGRRLLSEPYIRYVGNGFRVAVRM